MPLARPPQFDLSGHHPRMSSSASPNVTGSFRYVKLWSSTSSSSKRAGTSTARNGKGEDKARQMVEFGHVLPEPGDEPAWMAALPEADRKRMQNISVDTPELIKTQADGI